MNEKLAHEILKQLSDQNVEIKAGLSLEQIAKIEHSTNITFPPDLKIFLGQGVPVGEPGSFPDWTDDPEKIMFDARDFVYSRFEFDIEDNDYWHESLGVKPDDIEAAKKQAIEVVKSWPTLVPVFAHRFIPSYPNEPDNPVLSVWQPVDTIIYGNNLAGYLIKELSLDIEADVPVEAKPVPYWGPAFGLDADEEELIKLKKICTKYGAPYSPPDYEYMVGVADGIGDKRPIHGLRHRQEKGTTGWYIWSGEYSQRANFFKPMHIRHLLELHPELLPYLVLPPGWRFLLVPEEGHEDVWYDERLLHDD